MRYEVEAVNEVNRRVGDRVFNNQPGDKLELSGAGVEVALSPMMDGAYVLARKIPETDEEKERAGERAKIDSERARLQATPKKKLVAGATKDGIEEANNLNKEPLVDAILENKFGAETLASANDNAVIVNETATAETAAAGSEQPAGKTAAKNTNRGKK